MSGGIWTLSPPCMGGVVGVTVQKSWEWGYGIVHGTGDVPRTNHMSGWVLTQSIMHEWGVGLPLIDRGSGVFMGLEMATEHQVSR